MNQLERENKINELISTILELKLKGNTLKTKKTIQVLQQELDNLVGNKNR